MTHAKKTFSLPVDHTRNEVFVTTLCGQHETKVPAGSTKPDLETPPKTTLLLMHDLGESSAAVTPLAETLASMNFNVMFYDQRGHGRSGTKFGHFESIETLARDLLQVLNWIRFSLRTKTTILSFGWSEAVIDALPELADKYIDRIVMIAPAKDKSRNEEKSARSRRVISQFLSKVLPTSTVPLLIRRLLLSHQQKMRSKLSEYPLSSTSLNSLVTSLSENANQQRPHLASKKIKIETQEDSEDLPELIIQILADIEKKGLEE